MTRIKHNGMCSMMPNWPVFKKGTQFAGAFWNDTSGVILPYVTVMLVVIVGLSVLALDGARLMSLQTQLQNGADALALAGAAELDRLPDAETRARTAIERLLTNSTLFGSGASRTIAVSNIKFYSRLPASDAVPMSAGRLATGPANARFVSVTVRPVTLTTILPAAFFGGANMVTTAASAVAGFDQVVCGVTPIYVCNPYETAGMTYDQATEVLQHAAANPTDQARLIRLRQYGGNAHYAAADYGFLSSPTLGTDEMSLIDSIAVVRPAACFLQRGVNFRPGVVRSVREGFNVRFDIYEGVMSDKYGDSNYRPAQNVRKGYVVASGDENQNACAARRGPPNQVMGLPLDRTWPYFAAWAKETGTSIPIGRSITATLDSRQLSTVERRAMPMFRADIAFTAMRSNKALSQMCPSVGNWGRPPAIVATICPGRRIAASSMPPLSIVRACGWWTMHSPMHSPMYRWQPSANSSSRCLWQDRKPTFTSRWSGSSGRAMASASTWFSFIGESAWKRHVCATRAIALAGPARIRPDRRCPGDTVADHPRVRRA